MTMKKRLMAILTTFALTGSLFAISASAFTASYYGRATGGTGTNAYVSCLSNGAHPSDVITGLAWTKTSSNNNNVFTPNCAYTGYVYVSASIGGVGCGSAHDDNASGITHNFSLAGCTTTKEVYTLHIYDSTVHGYFSKGLSTYA
ncbi:MAG: hypothetical protein J5582_03900 [Ruminococcus sp.]|uniref:hypothetical protein n=1 Tax=Ruminococcus sp. TaxID=41978 RepID=UPI0026004A15|nr:hypothetical protein [Ruminococcus sp.]MBO4865699.1 hypothetical protein [Ruminococcus sp.]